MYEKSVESEQEQKPSSQGIVRVRADRVFVRRAMNDFNKHVQSHSRR